MKTTIFKEFTFEAAHKLTLVPPDHKCARLHGHSYHVRVEVTGEVDKFGMVIDYGFISLAWEHVFNALDHRYLNDIPGLEVSTSENLAAWIWRELKPALPGLSKVIVKETPNAGAIVEG